MRRAVNKKNKMEIKRWFKFKYIQLFRAKGGSAKVARGFSVGLAIEMITLPTFGLAAVLILPLAYFLRASLAGALIGFVFGKIIYIPMAFVNTMVGAWIVPPNFAKYLHFLPDWLEVVINESLKLIVGGSIVGIGLGLVVYFPVKLLLDFYTERRKEKRRKRKAELDVMDET